MKTPKIAKAISNIDDDLIISAEEGKKYKIKSFIKWSSFVACFVAIVIVGAFVMPLIFNTDSSTEKRYKNYTLQTETSAIIWPWEYLTTPEKFNQLNIGDTKYMSRGKTVSETLIEDFIGTYAVFGYDEYTDETPSQDFEVYNLKHADKSQLVAVKMENSYYVFKNDIYSPPSTLGELFDLVNIPQVVELNRFSEERDGPDGKHFELSDDAYIWNILKECQNAPFIEDQEWNAVERENICFSITSDTLGVYKVGLIVTKDGYLWTNAFNWQYLFNIGEDAAQKIINFAKENSKETEYEDFDKTIAGKVTEINDEYFIVDDSVLCKNPEDGITYKILLNSLSITRHIDVGGIKIGSTVQVYYNGEIDELNNNTIKDATNLSEVIITDGETLILE
jgi:hypothetical protein